MMLCKSEAELMLFEALLLAEQNRLNGTRTYTVSEIAREIDDILNSDTLYIDQLK